MIYNIPLYTQKNIGFFLYYKNIEKKKNRNLIRKRFWRENHSIIKYIHSNDIILFEEYAIINNENIQFNNYIIIYIINYFANSQLIKENLSFYSIYRPTSNPFWNERLFFFIFRRACINLLCKVTPFTNLSLITINTSSENIFISTLCNSITKKMSQSKYYILLREWVNRNEKSKRVIWYLNLSLK